MLRYVEVSSQTLSMFNRRAKPTSDLLTVPKLCLDLSIEGTLPIAQSTPDGSFMSDVDATTALDLSRRRRLVRTRVAVAPSDVPVTPLPRRRVPVGYSPEVGLGRLIIDETATTTVTVPVTSGDLDISWLSEQQTRLETPPGPTK